MGVTLDELLANAVRHIVKIKHAALLLHKSVEHDLHEQIPQLLTHESLVILIYSLDDLVGLLYEIFLDALVGLLGIPRASAGCAEKLHDLHKVISVIFILKLKILHFLPPRND